MSLTEETEEQSIDRLLRELGIRLPELELTDEEPLPPMFSVGAEMIPLPDEVSEWLPQPFSS
jgi:hypothetical protein